MKVDWKDETSYSQNDKERIPSVWRCQIGLARISVHRHMHYEPDQWLLTAHGILSIERHLLKNKDLFRAQIEALRTVLKALKPIVTDLEDLLGPPT